MYGVESASRDQSNSEQERLRWRKESGGEKGEERGWLERRELGRVIVGCIEYVFFYST